MGKETSIKLTDNFRIFENDYGVFIQRRGSRYNKHNKGRSWKTVAMYSDLKDAFRAWENKSFEH